MRERRVHRSDPINVDDRGHGSDSTGLPRRTSEPARQHASVTTAHVPLVELPRVLRIWPGSHGDALDRLVAFTETPHALDSTTLNGRSIDPSVPGDVVAAAARVAGIEHLEINDSDAH